MIKKITLFLIFLIIFNIFNFIMINKIYGEGEEEKNLEIYFDEPFFLDYKNEFVLPKIAGIDNYILIPKKPIVPYKLVDLEFPLDSEIISVTFNKVFDKENEKNYKLNKPLFICPEPKPLSNLNFNSTIIYEEDFENYIVERGRDSLILHLRITPFEVNKDNLYEISFYKKVDVKIKYVNLYSTHNFNNTKSNYELLIITPQEFQANLNDFINHKNQKNISSTLFTLEYIISNFTGRDTQEKIKYAIKYALDNYNIKYVLLIGDSEKIPPRYVAVNDGEESTLPSDLYYADIYNSSGLFDTWDKNNNNIFGEYNSNGNIDKPDLYPDVSIGRIPVSNTTELNNYIQKVLYYENNDIESWFKKTLLVGVATFSYPNFAEGEYCKETIANNYLTSFQNNKLYQTDLYQNTLDPTPSNINNILNSGVGFLNFAGHGSPISWGNNNPPITCYNVSSNMSGLNNENKLPIIFSNACSTARFDDTEAMPEYFLSYYSKGAIGFIGATRIGWAYRVQWFNNALIGKMDNLFFKGYSLENKDILGDTWKYMINRYVTENGYSSVQDFKTITELTLFGDPSLKIGGYSLPPPPPKVTLLQPNGGESLTAGTSYKIKWSYEGISSGYIKIELYKNGVLNRTITTSATITTGEYNWSIPTTQVSGSDYKIKITYTGNTTVFDESDDYFTIESPNANWTILVYLDGDNDLEYAAIDDINEMEQATLPDSINVIVQIDRAFGYDTSNGDWTTTRRYKIVHDTNTSIISSQLIQDMGELNMGDPQTLINFANWGIQNYPANNYMLILWDHGSGWKNMNLSQIFKWVCYDNTNNDYITTIELRTALNSIYATTGKKLGIIAFDACLMGMTEIGYEIRDYVDIMVASEETIPGDGFPYNDILISLSSNPIISKESLSSLIVNKYVQSYSGGSQGYSNVTLSAINLNNISILSTKVSELANLLIDSFSTFKTQINNARNNALKFADSDYKDLYHFTSLIKSNISDISIQNKSQEVLDSFSSVIISEAHTSYYSNAHGLSIYYPWPANYYNSYGNLLFAQDTLWDELIQIPF